MRCERLYDAKRQNKVVIAGNIPIICVFFFDHRIKVVLVCRKFGGRLL